MEQYFNLDNQQRNLFLRLFFIGVLTFGCKQKIEQQSFDLVEKEGMVWIPSGTFIMGSDAPLARPDESPEHQVQLEGFGWIKQK